jgi:anaphase-promoting complex subunit 2
MLKDVGDSKRIHSAVSSAMLDNDMGDAKRLDNFELQGLILSSEFWPAFREESLEFPSSVQERIDIYSQEYGRLKGMRKLEWKANLGMVDVEIDCGEQRLSMAVSPIRAVLIYQFQFESKHLRVLLGMPCCLKGCQFRVFVCIYVYVTIV